MALKIVVPEKNVEQLLDESSAIIETEGTKYPGMTYEEGIRAGIEYLLGISDSHPLK